MHFFLSLATIIILRDKNIHQKIISSPVPYPVQKTAEYPLFLSPGRSDREHKFPQSFTTIDTSTQIKRSFLILMKFLSEMGIFNMWIIACALCASLDSGLSGYALRKVPLALYTMVKSSTPIFILISRILFQLERPSFSLAGIIFIIAFGVFLTTKSDALSDKILPMLLVGASCVFAGLRWAFFEMFIICNTRQNGNTILHNLCVVSLLMALFVFGGFLFFEHTNPFSSIYFPSKLSAIICFSMIICGSIITYFLYLSEYLIIEEASIIALSVVGIVKELLIVFISVGKGQITLSKLNIIGLFIAFVGISLFIFRHFLFPEDKDSSNTVPVYVVPVEEAIWDISSPTDPGTLLIPAR